MRVYTAIIASFSFIVFMPVAFAGVNMPTQEEAVKKVLWPSSGRERPSRRTLKAKVRESMSNSTNSFLDYRLELRKSQQQRTIDNLRTTRQIINEEQREAREAQQVKKHTAVRKRLSQRVQERLSHLTNIPTVRNISADIRQCEKLPRRARRMCIIDTQRQKRAGTYSDNQQKEALKDSTEVYRSSLFSSPSFTRKLRTKPISRRSTSGQMTGATYLEFPEEVGEEKSSDSDL